MLLLLKPRWGTKIEQHADGRCCEWSVKPFKEQNPPEFCLLAEHMTHGGQKSIWFCSFTCSCQQHKQPKPPNPVRHRAPAEWLSMNTALLTVSYLMEASISSPAGLGQIPAKSFLLITSVIALTTEMKSSGKEKPVSSTNVLHVI